MPSVRRMTIERPSIEVEVTSWKGHHEIALNDCIFGHVDRIPSDFDYGKGWYVHCGDMRPGLDGVSLQNMQGGHRSSDRNLHEQGIKGREAYYMPIHRSIPAKDVPMVKGMLLRNDPQQDIAWYVGVNNSRVNELKKQSTPPPGNLPMSRQHRPRNCRRPALIPARASSTNF